ncbi:hypothetical protein HII28_00260 [Planctomonas sp. JC2975]|uniref:hypothetical protein n=1 Tax=Planctomonas sp. JC2975 TaxID=2729626 RepID=UPI0014738F74|nr:hypothetical protein [Planctomonas sp. JC2975]NNC10318.1 hypothetical protein [Planctomonas sp. JC2975]
MAEDFDGALAAIAARDRCQRHAESETEHHLVLDVLCILGVVALGVVVSLVGKAVEKL